MRPLALACVALAFAALACFCSAAADPSPDVLHDPPRDSFLLLPLHVHILSCPDRDDIDCHLTDDDVRRIVGKVNGIWHKAGIHFCLQPILHEKAANVPEFTGRLPLPTTTPAATAPAAHADATTRPTTRPTPAATAVPLGLYRTLAPPDSRQLPGLHVYYIHRFAVNGVYLGGSIAFVQETARLRPVEGGIDEPLPRVTAHELGHALGLPHRQDTTNLLASGTTGTKLNEAEVAITRSRAAKIDGALTVPQALDEKDPQRAKRLAEELDKLPQP